MRFIKKITLNIDDLVEHEGDILRGTQMNESLSIINSYRK